MAEQFPIDQEFGRFIDSMKPDDEGVEVDMPEDLSDVEELPDGSAVVSLDDFKGPSENEDFYENLAEVFNPLDLSTIAMRYVELIEKDKEARKQRDKQYEEGLKRTGLGNDAPGGATFSGASKVVHPVMAEACVDFAAKASKELFPPDGPVRTKILGEVTDEKVEVAERKRDYINWQLTEQIEEFKDELDQMLTQLPLGGSQYMKLWYDEKKKRPCAEFVPIDNMILPFAATNFYTAQRATEMQDITEWEMKQRIEAGLYRDINLVRSTLEPEETGPEKANNKIEGRQYQDSVDGLRRVYHVYTYLSFDDDSYTKGETAPYILMIDDLESEVIGLYRNWEDGDDTMTRLDWHVEFKFIPWRGAYAIGLPHLIGGLSAALTGALRALMDSAHINNAATMLKLKGAKVSGQSQQVEVTQVAEIEAAPGVDDIKKVAMPMPFNPPSPVLFQLLGWLTDAAKGVVTTSEEKIAEASNNMPVGTAQALIEQGATVFSSIHGRLHDSQRRLLMILQRINRWYLDEQKKGDVVAELPIKKEDFRRNTDIIPVSDPHIFSETQRMAQSQSVLQLAIQFPALIDQRVALSRILKQLKVPNINELMPNQGKAQERNAAEENAAMTLGQSAFAYPRQDHMAHIMTHLNYAMDPNLGASRLIAPRYIPQALEHIKQHLILWYTQEMEKLAKPEGKNVKFGKYEDSKFAAEIDRVMMLASEYVRQDSQQKLTQITAQLTQLGQFMQQFQQQPPMDPEAQAVLQASMAETQRRAARDQAELALQGQKFQVDSGLAAQRLQAENARNMMDRQIEVAMNAENNLTKERMKAADLTIDEARLRKEQYDTAIQLNNAIQRDLGG